MSGRKKRSKKHSDRFEKENWSKWCEVALSSKVLLRPSAMVFEGGGVLGMAYVGALRVTEQRNVLSRTSMWAGASTGSLYASMMACGADARYLEHQLETTDFARLRDDSTGFVRDAWRLYWSGGAMRGVSLQQQIDRFIVDLTGDAHITFGELYRRKQNKLKIVTTSMTERRTLIYDHRRTPQQQVGRAVMASCSFPLAFPLVHLDHHALWDGGLLNNFPLGIYDEHRATRIDQPHARWPNLGGTLGMKLLLPDEYRLVDDNGGSSGNNKRRSADDEIGESTVHRRYPTRTVVDAVKGMIGCWTDAALRVHVDSHIDWPRTMPIRLEQNLSILDFDLSDEQKQMLQRCGTRSATRFLDKLSENAKESE